MLHANLVQGSAASSDKTDNGAPEWQQLGDPRNESEYCAAWLALQCGRLTGVKSAILILNSAPDDITEVVATWPQQDLDLPDLLVLAKRALAEGRAVVSMGRGDASGSPVQAVGLLVAVPLGTGRPIAVAALALSAASGATSLPPESIAEQLKWGAGWLEGVRWARETRDSLSAGARSAVSLDVLALAGEHTRLQATAMAVVNDLATRLACDRVSIGLLRPNGFVRVRAISHSANFKKKSRLVEALASAMDEAIDQNSSVAWPQLPSTEPATSFFHRALVKEIGSPDTQLLTVVLLANGNRPVGALVLERHRNDPFSLELLRLAEAIAALLGPFFALQVTADRPVAGRIANSVGSGLRLLFGPSHPALKLGAVAVLAALLAVSFVTMTFRVTAKTVLEGRTQRAAVAPFDGFLKSAPHRAGDRVRAGELLATLDDKDLALEKLKWRAELNKLQQKYRQALAKHDRTPLVLLTHQIDQAKFELALAEDKMARSRIVAPISGLVVTGDLTQTLGSPVERGKVLFELAPLDQYRLNIQVDERDMRFVELGQTGAVTLAGRPGRPIPFTITKITPVTSSEAGVNTFKVEARLDDIAVPLRPGLEGVAKIDTNSRSILWIWTHSSWDWLRLTLWKYIY